MIREACACGATFLADFSEFKGATSTRECDAAEAWRKDHKHRATAQEALAALPADWKPLSQREGSGSVSSIHDPDMYALNKDYILNGDLDPVWIGATGQPEYFATWARYQGSLNREQDLPQHSHYAAGVDYLINQEGKPVWISKDWEEPDDFKAWAGMYVGVNRI
jgi:hypothetical protein